ncbi:MAG: hypothetical protein AOA65_0025 [Candidatus Bathyarchaeota archaeon BA1]|nr:MAG: hypothetical protein AOA65_0025 [Candidatus Bathyarchaeota archaeon BA1]
MSDVGGGNAGPISATERIAESFSLKGLLITIGAHGELAFRNRLKVFDVCDFALAFLFP